ncbi:MAG: InlB B-repeat-containing protein [Spirochaetales bacterium]
MNSRRLAALFSALLILTSCAPVVSFLGTTLTLNLPRTQARTILANAPAAEHYQATLVNGSENIDLGPVMAGQPYTVAEGEWTVEVTAFDAVDRLIGRGSTKVTLVSGANDVTIRVLPTQEASGAFSIALNFSEAASLVDFVLSPWPIKDLSQASPDAIANVALDGTAPLADATGRMTAMTYSLSSQAKTALFEGQLKSGTYLVQLRLTNNDHTQLGIYSEILHVYDFASSSIALSRPSFLVLFDANGGEGMMADLPLPFDFADALPNASFSPPVGQAFAGWNTQADGKGTSYGVGATFRMTSDRDVNLYAQWVNQYYVTFNPNLGTGSVAALPLAVGTSGTVTPPTGLLPPSTAPQSLFAGWNTLANGNGTNYAEGATFTMPSNATGDVVLYAKWTYRYLVNFGANTGTGNLTALAVAVGATTTLPSLGSNMSGPLGAPAFGGWNTAANGSGTAIADAGNYTLASNATGDVILYAQWLNQYRVLFDPNGGSGDLTPLPLVVGTSGTLPSSSGLAPPSTAPYSLFASWNTQANGSGTTYSNAATFTMPANSTGDFTLHARWTYRYQVVFDANTGSGSLSPLVLAQGSTTTLPSLGSNMTGPSGATVFTGWNTQADGSGTAYSNAGSFTMASNATADVPLYAQWVAVPVYALNVISTNLSYGTVSVQEAGTEFPAGTVIHLTATPASTYAFVDWQGDSAYVAGTRSAVTTLTMPSSPVSLRATFGVPATGQITLTDNMSKGRTGSYADVYSFTISAAQTVTISMVAPGSDSYLFLYKDSWGGTIVAANDDSGGTYDSMITMTLAAPNPLVSSTDTYYVEATTFSPGATFGYALSASSYLTGAIVLTAQ